MRRQLSDEAIELLTDGLDGFTIYDNIFDDESIPNGSLPPDNDFTRMLQNELNVWYNQKTKEEKVWLNTNNDAKQMVTLMLNGFDNLMKVNGV